MTREAAKAIIKAVYEEQLKDEFLLSVRDEVMTKVDDAFKVAFELLDNEPCEDCVNKEQALLALTGINLSTKSTEELISLFNKRIKALPPVTHAHKKGKWIDTKEISTNRRGQIVHEVICSECNGISYFRSMGNKYIGANLCPNCGSRNEVTNY